MPKPEPIETRFWRYVSKTSRCWNWTGQKLPRGYGTIKADRSRKNVYAHRASWEMHRGPIPFGLFVLHKCDNPSCVRPSHLFLGTHDDNMADMSRKGRATGAFTVPRGDDCTSSKLTARAVRDIRSSTASLTELAKKYGVLKGAIWKVRARYSWKHLP